MAKTRDVPKLLRAFNGHFEQFTTRHDWGRSYCDFIQWIATSYAFKCAGINDEWLDKRHEDAIRRYSEKERKLLKPMLHSMAVALEHEVSVDGWGDQIGHFYEVIASQHKSSWLGQFFTPTGLCTMIAQMQGTDIDRPIVYDPACGSGRLLLAHHSLAPQNRGYYVAADVDPVCCDMTAINMMMHGMEGEALEMNSLSMKFNRGWRINPWLHTLGMVCIVPILTPAHCYFMGGHPLMFGHWQDRADELARAPREPPVPITFDPRPAKQAKPQKVDSQLKFDF